MTIVLPLAGSYEECKQLVDIAKKKVKIYKGRDSEQMLRVKNSFEKFRKKWKRQNPGDIFQNC